MEAVVSLTTASCGITHGRASHQHPSERLGRAHTASPCQAFGSLDGVLVSRRIAQHRCGHHRRIDELTTRAEIAALLESPIEVINRQVECNCFVLLVEGTGKSGWHRVSALQGRSSGSGVNSADRGQETPSARIYGVLQQQTECFKI